LTKKIIASMKIKVISVLKSLKRILYKRVNNALIVLTGGSR
jgi:hypothetical protein